MANNNKLFMATPCFHYFHSPCMEAWLLEKTECPMCNKDIPAMIPKE